MRKLFWNLHYLAGTPPWDTGITPPEVVELIEGGQVPPGRALDIGCGTGTNAIYLARHGFQVVGVDVAWMAIRRARRKARQAGMSASFYTSDILKLGTPAGPPVGAPFDLALDIGCLHSLAPSHWPAYAAMLYRVLRVGGLYLLYAWGPRQMGGRPFGLTPEETQAVLGSDLHARWIRSGEERGSPAYWYLFERRSPIPQNNPHVRRPG